MYTKKFYTIFFIFTLFHLTGFWFMKAYSDQTDLPVAGNYIVVAEKSSIQVKAGTSGAFGFLGHGHIMSAKTFKGVVNVKPKESIPASVS
ncbi:hypothetical protein L0244_37065, partial [bacterium]|nr:hypothetical protein [bacterium]